MTNNFDLIQQYMINEGIPVFEKDMGDLFFSVMLVRRGKDHPDLPAANYTFKTYYIDSIEKYRKLKDEMIKCCEMFGLRAYVSVNVKSKEKFSKTCSLKLAKNILNNEYKKPWRVIDHVFGKIPAKNKKNNTWIIDIDYINLKFDNERKYVDELKDIINSCSSEYDKNVLFYVPTKSGIHMLTKPFNIKEFKLKFESYFVGKKFDLDSIKRNHITLLYENILLNENI